MVRQIHLLETYQNFVWVNICTALCRSTSGSSQKIVHWFVWNSMLLIIRWISQGWRLWHKIVNIPCTGVTWLPIRHLA